MKERLLFLFTLICTLIFTSCGETGAENSYTNWKERNTHYIDSIAAVAKANLGTEVGKWKIIKSYTSTTPDAITGYGDTSEYVYAQIKEIGTGTESPLFTDSVGVNYRGWNIINEVFDQSYKGPFEPSIDEPYGCYLKSVVNGWTTVLQQMHEGDRWQIYIPNELGYKSADTKTTIPAYSTLIFDINLVYIYKVGRE